MTGLYEIPLNLLKEPPADWKIRPLHQPYVDELKTAIKSNPSHQHLTNPLIALVDTGEEEFRPSRLGNYSFHVVGGLHRLTAQKQLLQEKPGSTSLTRRCQLYKASMPLEAILRLANLHNLTNALTRPTAFIEHAQKCRELLFSTFAEEGDKDDGECMPEVPHYNHHNYIRWKRLCLAHIVGPNVVSRYVP